MRPALFAIAFLASCSSSTDKAADDCVADGPEVCDGVDNDCDGQVDDADGDVDLTTGTSFFADQDGDGFGAQSGQIFCDVPSGFVTDNTDCDDSADWIHPNGVEVCDALAADEDCNGLSDDDDPGLDPGSLVDYWPDDDADGYGDEDRNPVSQCTQPSGAVADGTDCDDSDENINPAATEICDPFGDDQDCDGLIDDDDPDVDPASMQSAYPDGDLDGFGDENGVPVDVCRLGPGFSDVNTDCDDATINVNPDAAEVCDPLDTDEDCNGLADDDDPGLSGGLVWYPDLDGDGFGDNNNPVVTCEQPYGFVADNSDCGDVDPFTIGGVNLDVWIDASDSLTVDYTSGTVWRDNRVRAYQSPPGYDAVGWQRFDTATVAGATVINEITLHLHGENAFGSPNANPETAILHSTANLWTRVSSTDADLPRGAEVSVAPTLNFDPTTYNAFPLDPLSWDLQGDLQDGVMTLGIDNILATYSYVYFYGTDDPATIPQLHVIGLTCP